MQITATPLPDVWQIDSPRQMDARGHFIRLWCQDSFAKAGLAFAPVQASQSYNTAPFTLRGMHWQDGAYGEQKLVRCAVGKIWDVALDLRPHSPSYRRWFGAELSAQNQRALLLPRGVAHGFITLEAGSVVDYLIDTPFEAAAARGARWDDAAFGIDWPARPKVMSERDLTWPDFHHG